MIEIILSTDADELWCVNNRNEVSFELQNTTELDDYADGIRGKRGYIPFFDDLKEWWDDGWYEFYLRVNPKEKKVIDIDFVVQGNCADETIVPDDKTTYSIGDYVDLSGVMEQLEKLLEEKETSLEEIAKEVEKEYE